MLKEGKKEIIECPIGTKCYLRLDCIGKTFPLKVKILVMTGIFEIYVSKSTEKPDKHNCDHSFNASSFEVNYSPQTEVKSLYFCVSGVGKLKIAILVSFISIQEPKRTSEPIRRPVMKHKTMFPPNIYEFCKEGMSQEEKEEFKKIISKELFN